MNRGRPPKDDGRTKGLRIRLTEEEHISLKAAADSYGMTMSELVRSAAKPFFNQTELKAKQILADLAGNEEAKAYSESLNNIMARILLIQNAQRKREAKLDEL